MKKALVGMEPFENLFRRDVDIIANRYSLSSGIKRVE